MDSNLLFDASQPFTGEKLQMLESLVSLAQSGDAQKMSQAGELLTGLQQSAGFWLQTDEVIQRSSDVQTVFFALAALHAGVKVR